MFPGDKCESEAADPACLLHQMIFENIAMTTTATKNSNDETSGSPIESTLLDFCLHGNGCVNISSFVEGQYGWRGTREKSQNDPKIKYKRGPLWEVFPSCTHIANKDLELKELDSITTFSVEMSVKNWYS
jgi:hypothetical protein